jgi:hypothetical protein
MQVDIINLLDLTVIIFIRARDDLYTFLPMKSLIDEKWRFFFCLVDDVGKLLVSVL